MDSFRPSKPGAYQDLCMFLMARPLVRTPSGIPDGFVFGSMFTQAFADETECWVFPPEGGCILLGHDGTWQYDDAPFAD